MQKHIPTVLVVENQKSLLKVWAEVFKREGLNVLTAPDEPSALNAALRWRPDLLVVDLVMPMNLIKKLRENKWGQKVPVMFLSGWFEIQAGNSNKDSYFNDNWSFDQVVNEAKDRLKFTELDGLAAG